MSKNFLIQKLQGRVSTCLNITSVSLEQHFTAFDHKVPWKAWM